MGEIERKSVVVIGSSSSYNIKFKEAMSWINSDIDVLCMSLIKHKYIGDNCFEEYIVVYRNLNTITK